MKTLRLLTLFLMLAFIATACPSDTTEDNSKCSPENVSGTCSESNQVCRNGVCVIENKCTPTCNGWETCEADNKCSLKAGKCNVKEDCSANQVCNNNSCEDATVECNPACNSWETCETNGQCKLKDGRCNVLGDCDVNQVCNAANRCENHIECGTCDDWKECNFSNGTCEVKDGKCDANGDCPLDKPVCDKPNHSCISQSDVCSPVCNDWETCNAGNCDLQAGKCNSHNDCVGDERCTADHECKVPVTCTPACEYWEDCNAGSCDLKADFCDATTNCGTDKECSTSTHKCVDVPTGCTATSCETWEECNTTSGDCELKADFCNAKADCPHDTDICTIDHTCQSTAITCTAPPCEYWESCVSTNNCQLKADYCTENSCAAGEICDSDHRCKTDICANETCSGHGTCVSNGDQASCTCAEGYIPNGLTCELSPACSVANLTGACADPCDTCNNGVCSNTTGYKCDGTFNAKCDPAKALVNGQHPDCASGTFCSKDPDNPTEGYCSYYGCQNDTECTSANYPARSQDKFICLDYGAEYNGVCIKMEDACTNPPRNIPSYGSCDTSCGDGSCSPADLCLNKVCSPECDPNNNTSCQSGYECKNISSADNPMYRCLVPIATCGSDANCSNGEMCNSFTADTILGEDAILSSCGEAEGTLEGGATCLTADTAPANQSCKDNLCLAAAGAAEGTCYDVCDSSAVCSANEFCYAVGIFGDNYGDIPLCLDETFFTNLTYNGKCSQAGGCPANSYCSFTTVATVVEELADIEYQCFGPLPGSGDFGTNCTEHANCKSGYCAADGKCGAFCDTDDNCPSGKTCSGTLRYYPDTVDNATTIKVCQ